MLQVAHERLRNFTLVHWQFTVRHWVQHGVATNKCLLSIPLSNQIRRNLKCIGLVLHILITFRMPAGGTSTDYRLVDRPLMLPDSAITLDVFYLIIIDRGH